MFGGALSARPFDWLAAAVTPVSFFALRSTVVAQILHAMPHLECDGHRSAGVDGSFAKAWSTLDGTIYRGNAGRSAHSQGIFVLRNIYFE